MFELFAVGTLLFWVLVFVVCVIITALVENEKGAWATVTAIATAILLNWAWKVPIIQSINEHKLAAVLWLLGYYALGVVWGFIKWTLFVHKMVGVYNEFKANFLKENKATELTPELAAKLKDKIDGGYGYSSSGIKVAIPTASENKGRIIRWMTYWPFSIIGTLLNDVVRRLWHHIYQVLSTTYDRVAIRLWRNVTADMELAVKFKAEQAKKEAEEKAAKEAENRSRRY